MSFSVTSLFIGSVLYLLMLFFIAYATEKGWIPTKISRHPIVYCLSITVFASAWTICGGINFASEHGYNYLSFYIGATLAFALAPVLFVPILRTVRDYQLSSLADLFAFRYQSQLVGIVITLLFLVSALPYFALQIVAITHTAAFITGNPPSTQIALTFCLTTIAFSILFGARHLTARDRHDGLVVAIAFESIIKVLGALVLVYICIYSIFGGLDKFTGWLSANPQAVAQMYDPPNSDAPWLTLIFLSFGAAFLLPRQFHMIFVENNDPKALHTVAWMFPLMMLIMSIAVPPVLWAAEFIGTDISSFYYVVAVMLETDNSFLIFNVFITAVSAASAMIIVSTLALSSMCVNHLVLPIFYPGPSSNIYKWVLLTRRIIIALIILAGYGFYELSLGNEQLSHLGLVSFLAVAQCLPGLVGTLWWPRATRNGFLAGIIGGATVWFFTLVIPLLSGSQMWPTELNFLVLKVPGGLKTWEFATWLSLSTNALLFFSISLLENQDSDENKAAIACRNSAFALPSDKIIDIDSPQEFEKRLAIILGPDAAKQEVKLALKDLDMKYKEANPSKIRQLQERIERNLSGLLGPMLARMIVDKRLQSDHSTRIALIDNIRFIEEKIDRSQMQFEGVAEALDTLRRMHQQILLQMPIGVCAVDNMQRVVLWNNVLAKLSHISIDEARHSQIAHLPSPWEKLFGRLLEEKPNQILKQQVMIEHDIRWLDLHKANITGEGGVVFLVEDVTDIHELEHELTHADRLASVGRLAAGVAHEIGNPVAGIASLIQNLQYELEHPVVQETSADVLEQTNRITNIVQSLVRFSHSGAQLNAENVNVLECFSEATKLVNLSHSAKQIKISYECDEDIMIKAEHAHIVQVLVNLLTNAMDASEPGDCIKMTCDVGDDKAFIHVTDEGEGIPDHLLDKIFEPFVTTKLPGQGTGLGMAVVYRLIKEHNGSVRVQSEVDKGTTMTLELPLAKRSESDSLEEKLFLDGIANH